jgi:hypothetical protein
MFGANIPRSNFESRSIRFEKIFGQGHFAGQDIHDARSQPKIVVAPLFYLTSEIF